MKPKKQPEPTPSPLLAALAAVGPELARPELPVQELQAAAEELASLAGVCQARIARALAPSRREEAARLAEQGLTPAQIARRLAVREDYVRRLLSQAGVSSPRSVGRPAAKETWEQRLKPLLDEGLPVEEAAERLGWAVSTTRNRASKLRAALARREGSPKE